MNIDSVILFVGWHQQLGSKDLILQMVWKKKDIQEIMRQEQVRGTKKPRPDPDEIRKRLKKLGDIRALLRIGDKRTFLKALIDYGLQVGSKNYNLFLQEWTDFQRRRRDSG